MSRFVKRYRERATMIYWQMSKNLYRFRKYYLCNVTQFQLLLKKNKRLFMYTIIIIVQFLLLVKISINYRALYTLANSSYPDTFWHVYYQTSTITIRRTSNVSLAHDSVIVLACGRNVAEAIPVFQTNLYSILKLFKNYRVLLGESDSEDNTLMRFRHWKDKDSKIYVHTYGNLSVTYSKNRAHRIAFCRNHLLQTARENNWIDEARFLLVMDIDINANDILTVENFLTNFEYDTRDWAVMTASQTKLYYDIWAVRTQSLDYDCWEVVDPMKHQEIARKIYINVHMKPIPREFGLIPVRSAFGGFGVYQTVYINGCYYEAFDQTTKQKCEHISFHDCIIRNGGKIFINPKFQNADGLKN